MIKILKNSNLVIIVFFCLLAFVEAGKLWGQQSHTPAEVPSSRVLTQIREILQLPNKEADEGQPVRVQAVVTFYEGRAYRGLMILFIHDSSGGIFVREGSAQEDLNLTPGDLVEVKGVTAHGFLRNEIRKPEVHTLGRAPLPDPRHPRPDQLVLGRLDCEWVEITGFVTSTQVEEPSKRLILDVTEGEERVKVVVLKYPQRAPTDLLHAKVRFQGVCGGNYNAKNEMTGILIRVQDISFVHNLGTGPSAEESPPAESSRELASLNARR